MVIFSSIINELRREMLFTR